MRPVYPADALEAKIDGVVLLDVFIDTAGRVRDARVIGSVVPMLDEAALAAVWQREFTPPNVGREKVPAVMAVPVPPSSSISGQPVVLDYETTGRPASRETSRT